MVKWKNYQTGFTLIEILVVLVIISIVTAVAVLAFGDFGRGRREKIVADLLQKTIPVAQQRAILQPAILGLSFSDQGYQFRQYWVDPETKKATWKALSDDDLSRQNAFRDINYQLKLLEKNPDFIKKNKTHLKIIFLPNGSVTPFKLILSGEGKISYELQVQNNGTVTLKTKQ